MWSRQQKRYRRHRRVRAKLYGTGAVPRLCVFRSNKHIYAHLIDDEKGIILLTANDFDRADSGIKQNSEQRLNPRGLKARTLKEKKQEAAGENTKYRKVAAAYKVGRMLAQKALEKKIQKTVFDRDGYKYHGRVKAVAEGAREGGLKF